MNTDWFKVGYLKKIGLLVEAGTSEAHMNLTAAPFQLSFIYGVGNDGISLFEKALFEKQPGDEIIVAVPPHQRIETLGYLNQQIQPLLPQHHALFFLKARVASVDTADEREIIRAITEGVASGDCDCVCGCGC